MLISATDCPSTYVYIRFVSERLPCSCPVVLFLVAFTQRWILGVSDSCPVAVCQIQAIACILSLKNTC